CRPHESRISCSSSSVSTKEEGAACRRCHQTSHACCSRPLAFSPWYPPPIPSATRKIPSSCLARQTTASWLTLRTCPGWQTKAICSAAIEQIHPQFHIPQPEGAAGGHRLGPCYRTAVQQGGIGLADVPHIQLVVFLIE